MSEKIIWVFNFRFDAKSFSTFETSQTGDEEGTSKDDTDTTEEDLEKEEGKRLRKKNKASRMLMGPTGNGSRQQVRV